MRKTPDVENVLKRTAELRLSLEAMCSEPKAAPARRPIAAYRDDPPYVSDALRKLIAEKWPQKAVA